MAVALGLATGKVSSTRNAAACGACAAGTYSNPAGTACIACGTGKITDPTRVLWSDPSHCVSCLPGKVDAA
jgi:hypothetical protein